MSDPFRIRIGHSPDPDDAFLFYAMTQGKIPLDGFEVRHCLEGIEELNQRALRGEMEMSAISLHAYSYCVDRYSLLTTGASVGEGVGPIVVASRPMAPEEIPIEAVAVPGRLTTASLLLQLAAGKVKAEIMAFDQILDAVKQKRVASGVLIHEGQITYEQHGLTKVLDLGAWWKERTGLPVPLGVNVVRKDLGEGARRLARLFKGSLDYAFAHRQEALKYAMRYGRGLDFAMTDRFVGMYVNRWSVDCRPDGALAMQRLLDEAADAGLIPRKVRLEFVEA
jgi:1,4-dihydroxy-6-naphthoate synthase